MKKLRLSKKKIRKEKKRGSWDEPLDPSIDSNNKNNNKCNITGINFFKIKMVKERKKEINVKRRDGK